MASYYEKGDIVKNRVFLIMLVLLFVQPVFAKPVTVTLSTSDTEYIPHLIGTGGKFSVDRPGVAVEMLMLLEQLLDIKINFVRYPHLRNVRYLELGKIDGMFTWSFKKKRMKIAVYPMLGGKPDPSKRMFDFSYVVYKLKSSKLEWNGQQFINLNKPMGVKSGSSIATVLREKYNVKVDDMGVKYIPLNFKKLLLKRIDAVVELETAADMVINLNESLKKDIVKVGPSFTQKPYYLVLTHQFVKKYPELSKQIWDAIEEIREKHLKDLLKKYGAYFG
ncbi:MAG: hypothetical protein B6I31_02945 [Desulfobacteraceae bacterium 4572_19]|nr:MAG: hypothetical protein B6I31_02945 [Desulfobacteraceae bacterium 4572_19]